MKTQKQNKTKMNTYSIVLYPVIKAVQAETLEEAIESMPNGTVDIEATKQLNAE